MVISNVLDNIILFCNIVLIFPLIYSSVKDILLRKKFGPNNFKFYRLGPYSLQTMNKAQFNEQSAIYEHLSLCTYYSHIADLFKIGTNSFNSNQFNISQIRDNTIILDRGNNQNVLLFKEALMIKKHRSTLNCGLMASKEFKLFRLHFNDFIRHPIYSFNIKLIIPFLTF